jgi:hypothetical protein
VGANGVVVQAGTVLVIQQDGITALAAPAEYPCNTYKPSGHIKSSAMCAINYSTSKDQQVHLQVGGQVYLTAIQLKPAEIVFKLQTAASNEVPYKASISFQFAKGYQGSMNFKEIQDTISQILTPAAISPEPNPAPGPQQAPIPGLYVDQAGTQLQLNPDGSFSQHSPNGQVSPGHYTVNGDTLVLTYLASATPYTFQIQGGKIYTHGFAWLTRQGDAPVPAASLKLPATYASAQAPTDQLQLNADNSFSLQEAGQSYHGTFAINGNTLELSISESNTKTTATLQGNNLTDSSGQTWALRESSAGTAPGAALLQNEDVIKMAKAGFDDATIIAKISSSKCQFDTSTDALIRLKQSGVSAAVIKTMLNGGK